MFMLRNVSNYLFGDTSKETIIEVPQGQLYLVRPLSPKGYSELIFRDAAASIRRTGQQHQYQLIVQRAYEEGEEELLNEGDDSGTSAENLSSEKDERTFLLDESLQFRVDTRKGGEHVFAWRDLSGDTGDLYEFLCDVNVGSRIVTQFEEVAANCQYERKYRRSYKEATVHDLAEFSFTEQPIPHQASEATALPPQRSSPDQTRTNAKSATAKTGHSGAGLGTMVPRTPTKKMPPPKLETTVAPAVVKHPEGLEVFVTEAAELHLFDFESGTFILQDDVVQATVSDVGGWEYWLQITGEKRDWLGQKVDADINPVFNFEYLSFIFNYYTTDGSAYSWLLRFKDLQTIERFQEGLMQALWEHLNQTKWAKSKDTDREYVLDAFQDLVMEDASPEGDGQEDADLSEEEEDEDEGGIRSEHYDSDESQDDTDVQPKDGNVNSQLAVGYKNDRSFVVRGSRIGVFKHTPENRLEFSTSINKVQTPKGKLFSPKKIMLHAEDRNMVLQNPDDPNSLYRMDLEYGKVVDEWKIDDDIPVTSFAPSTKYAQMTNEQTFVGLSSNALFRIDPRLSGNKLVDSELKQYASNNDFSAAATTEKGYIAVASNKGDIRMFDRLGIIAKTALPALGEPIIGVDVSADGRWVLATCRTYLLLIDALQKEGKNAGKLGFEKAFGKDSKPQPRRLGLSPTHVAQMMHSTKTTISFTPAHFNAGVDGGETTVVTATGPYVVTWSMKKVLRGTKDPYVLKKYDAEVMADNFKFGSDKNVIVALPNEVSMVAKGLLRAPTRESIGGYALPSTPASARRQRTGGAAGRGSHLRNEIVDSPY